MFYLTQTTWFCWAKCELPSKLKDFTIPLSDPKKYWVHPLGAKLTKVFLNCEIIMLNFLLVVPDPIWKFKPTHESEASTYTKNTNKIIEIVEKSGLKIIKIATTLLMRLHALGKWKLILVISIFQLRKRKFSNLWKSSNSSYHVPHYFCHKSLVVLGFQDWL